MSPIIKRVGIGIGLATLLVIVVGFLLPADYTVDRSVQIKASPTQVHAIVSDLKQWPTWSPWSKADPSIVITYGAATTGVGAQQTWTSKNGGGSLTFTASDPAGGIAYEMELNGGKYHASATMKYTGGPDTTEVIWSMTGHNGNNPFNRYFGLMMDPMVGPLFEDGLNRLKLAVETNHSVSEL